MSTFFSSRTLSSGVLLTLLLAPAAAAGDTGDAGDAGDASFEALHFARKGRHSVNASVSEFSPGGPAASTMRPVTKKVRHIERDPVTGTLFALTTHDFGTIDDAGKFHEITPPAPLKSPSWPCTLGLAPEHRFILIQGRHQLYRYHIDDQTWTELPPMGGEKYFGFAYNLDDELFYGPLIDAFRAKPIEEIELVNIHGAVVGSLELSEPIMPVGGSDTFMQPKFADGELYLVVHHPPHPRAVDRIYRIDPDTGDVTATSYNQKKDPLAKLFPDWDGGPPPSVAIPMNTQYGYSSNYKTPDELLRRQRRELHVVAVASGDKDAWDALKRIKKLRIKDGSVQAQLDLTQKETAVEVAIHPTTRPVVLALSAKSDVVWNLVLSQGARLDEVILIGPSKQRVIGLPRGVRTSTFAESDRERCPVGWELSHNARYPDFDNLLPKLRKHTRLRENSFQATQTGRRFEIPFRAGANDPVSTDIHTRSGRPRELSIEIRGRER